MGTALKVEDISIRYITGDFKDIGLKEYVVRKLTKNYHVKDFMAVDNVSFELEEGDMLGIIGSNGAGKSTLLKAISSIMEPTKGKITANGEVAALLELGSGFDGDLTVRENAYLRGAMLGYTKEFMDQTYGQIIDFAELREFEDRPFKQLSSGMKSRLAFSIASLVRPDILILDEVLSVGDGAFQEKSAKKMQEIIGQGATTILVSHSLSQIRELCNKVLWLDHGRQVAFGETEAICNQYEKFLRGECPAQMPGVVQAKPDEVPQTEAVAAESSGNHVYNANRIIRKLKSCWKGARGVQFNGNDLKAHIKCTAKRLNIFLVILFAIMSYFLADVGFRTLNLNATTITISVQEDQDRPFTPDCLGIRGGFVDGVWMDPQGFCMDGNWRLTADNVYHMIDNEPIKLAVNYTESFDLIFNCGPTQAVAKIDVQGESFFFDCYNETEIPTGVGYRIPTVKTSWKSLCLFLLRWIATIALFLILIAMYSYRVPTAKQRAVLEKCYIVALFFLAVWFLYVSSWTTSPKVSPYANSWGWDGAYYKVLGKAVAAGRIPYVDIWEQKGAFTFLIYGLGYLIHPKRGLFPIQCFALFFSLYFSYRIGKELKDRRTGILASFITLAFLELVMDEGGLLEEFNLPFLMAGTYCTIKFLNHSRTNAKHPPQYAFIYGIVCAVSLGLRVTNCIPICVFVLCITVFLIIKKEFQNLWHNMFAFLCGFFAVYLPVVIYFAVHGALYDLLEGTILFSIGYTQASFSVVHSVEEWRTILLYLLPAIVSAVLAFEQPNMMRISVFASTLIYSIFLSRLNLYHHYYVTILVFVPIATAWLNQTFPKSLSPFSRYRIIYATLMICTLFSTTQKVCNLAIDRYASVENMHNIQEESEDIKTMREQISCIPTADRDKVLGYNVRPEWYLNLDIVPCYKFFAFQDMNFGDDINHKKDAISYFNSLQAKWIVIKGDIAVEEIAYVINQHYDLLNTIDVPSENAQFYLYHLK